MLDILLCIRGRSAAAAKAARQLIVMVFLNMKSEAASADRARQLITQMMKNFCLLGILALLLAYTKVLSQPKVPQESLRAELLSLMKLPKKAGGPLDFSIRQLSDEPNYTLYRVVIFPAPGDSIPCYFLTPKKVKAPYPVMICLQGHAPGMYISIGEARSERDKKLIEGGRDIALQAVAHGWAALTVEQRGFGEQQVGELSCNHVSLNGAIRGQPMIGQRVSDISYAIDFLQTRKDIQADKIGSMGNSAGGTVSYFAACADERIKLSVVSCSFSTYAASWLKYPHCACGYLPGLLEVADMPELAELIAPRHLLIVAGKKDYLADIEGVREGYFTAQSLFKKYNSADHVKLVEGEGGHQFYPELAWPLIDNFKSKGSFEN